MAAYTKFPQSPWSADTEGIAHGFALESVEFW